MPPLTLVLFGISAANIFADVVTLKDGRQLSGEVDGTVREVRIKDGEAVLQTVPIEQVQSIRFMAPAAVSVSRTTVPAPAAIRSLTLPSGTTIAVRTIDFIDSKDAALNREYAASLDEPLVVDGITIAPAKASAVLRVTDLKKPGMVKGSAMLSLRLTALDINGQRVSVETRDFVSQGAAKGKRTAAGTGVGAGVGAGIGAIGGGILGAGVGAAAGSAVGGTIAALSGQSHVQIASETRLTFALSQPVAVDAAQSPISLPTPLSPDAGPTRDTRSARHYSSGQALFRQQDWQAAANEFSDALNGDLSPRWIAVWSHIYLGQIFDMSGQRPRAIKEYNLALQTGDNTQGAQDTANGYLKTPYQGQQKGSPQ